MVLLELITGKPPIRSPEEGGGDLVNYVRNHKTCLISVFDQTLDMRNTSIDTVAEITTVLKIALLCTEESPADRPTMREVVSMLIDARVKSDLSL